MQKSPDAYRTISEVSEELGLPSHVLRFWETKFSVIRPVKRGGNRRYYRPEDICALRNIKKYLHEDGYTIKGLQKLLRTQKKAAHQGTVQETSQEDIIVQSIHKLDALAQRVRDAKFS